MFFVSLMRRVKETVVKREFVTNNSLSFSSRKNVFVVVYEQQFQQQRKNDDDRDFTERVHASLGVWNV